MAVATGNAAANDPSRAGAAAVIGAPSGVGAGSVVTPGTVRSGGPVGRTTPMAADGTTSAPAERGWRSVLAVSDAPRGSRGAALVGRLREAVRTGALPAGTRLPSTRTLAADLGVSRGVAVRAYEQLTAEGYLVAVHGSGTSVAAVAGDQLATTPEARRPPGNPGLPAGGSFPRAAWSRAASKALAELADADLAYGDPAGHPALRRELARYLGRVRGMVAEPGRIVVVNGFAQATRLLAEVLRAAGEGRIAIEDPGSLGLREQLTRAGLTCVPVPVDEHGLDVAALAATSVRAVVVTPAHQFPTGVVLAPERRHALLAWARSTGGLVVEDDYDAELRYDRDPIGALQGLGPDVVAHGGSVSKTLAPALRLGWLVLPDHLVGPVRRAKYDADLATGVLDQVTLAAFLAAGELDRHVRRCALRYRTRRDRLVAELATHLPGWRIEGTAAGLHVLLRPPPVGGGAGDGVTGDGATGDDAHRVEAQLVAAARAAGLDARPLGGYTLGSPQPPGLVVGYGDRTPDALAGAVRTLAATLGRREPR
ncbi:PLP-dependent aminotransferase family protein [Nitriliruptoraceae bacterium ZYF776]|nr:PLP-dependent aminotransferase family protein [Profundirhabdus halotolerans]